ncbi:MAG: dihydroneopterin aldolase [Patescibacteria group bacterium]|nr:dihydroneopterin aldolase [Patescibacteria group bacterium]MDE1965890.1 dihydroneopterin aldolase [Patescibacteria group bacterium]
MDRISIEDFRVRAAHGCREHEGKVSQEFVVSLAVGTDMAVAGKSDTLADTLDFDFLKRAITDAFALPRHFLIESLAEEIAGRVLKDSRAREVTVSIRKTEVWENGIPGVEIVRSQP